MDKRFQVFVSSTYADLRDERRRVIQTLMGMDRIPAGMELFPAADARTMAIHQESNRRLRLLYFDYRWALRLYYTGRCQL